MNTDAPQLVQALESYGCEPVAGYEDGSWSSKCPAHDDSSPSLSINLAGDGRLLLHCFAGCRVEDIVETLGLQMRDLFPDSNDDDPIRHIYLDEDGSPLYSVVRGPAKSFYQMHPVG